MTQEKVGLIRQGVMWLRKLILPSSGLTIGEAVVSVKDTEGVQDLFYERQGGFSVNLTGAGIAARVHNSGNVAIANNTNTALTFDSERFDTDSIHSTSSNTGRLTATVAGKYFITALVRWAANVTGRRTVFLRLNGSTDIAHIAADAATGGVNTIQEVSCLYELAKGDYVEVVVNQNSGGALNVEAASNYSPEFMMSRIGPTGGSGTPAAPDHGDCTGLGDDDHTQYLLAAGTRVGSTGTAQDFGSTGIKTDVIAESTGGAGVTVDGLLIKDSGIPEAAVTAHEAAIEAAIDTLANLTSVQGRVVTLADAGADALFGWDDTANAYENLSKAEALAVLNVADGADVTGSNAPQAHGPSSHTEGTGWRLVYQNTDGDDTEIGFSDDGKVLTSTGAASAPAFEALPAGGAHGIASHTEHAAWKVLYTDAAGDEQELALGADGEVLTSTGAAGIPAFEAGGGGSGSLITLTEDPADHAYTGIDVTLTAGENVVFGNVCYFKSDGKMWKADADAIATATAIGMAVATIAAEATGKFLLYGIAEDSHWNWTVGALLYLSITTGGMQVGAPVGTDDVIQILGVATHADRVFFNPQLIQGIHV